MSNHRLFFFLSLGFIVFFMSTKVFCRIQDKPQIQLAGLMQLFNDEEPADERHQYKRYPRQSRDSEYTQREYENHQHRESSYYGNDEDRDESQNSYVDDRRAEVQADNRPPIKRFYAPQKKVRYSTILCQTDEYHCTIVKRKQSWEKLFPDPAQRDIVRRLNRTNQALHSGQKIAVPKNLDQITLQDISPFDRNIYSMGKKQILVDLKKLAWAAYDESGKMLRWGPVSGGRGDCSDTPEPCLTIEGVFSVFQKRDKFCQSNSFPVDKGGGAPMPYCMFFSDGFALHGSAEVPGYNASHGCVRMFKEDAEWLNREFVELPQSESDKGTQVIVRTS